MVLGVYFVLYYISKYLLNYVFKLGLKPLGYGGEKNKFSHYFFRV